MSNKQKFKYIYGPVLSWRLGSSLGIDLLSQKEKTCNYNCTYCQIGRNSNYVSKRKVYVPTESIISELKLLPEINIDYITFSGKGEPTLAKNLGETIKAIRKIKDNKIAVLTNSSLIDRPDVREELSLADFVSIKLDAHSQESFVAINNPSPNLKFENILKGIFEFKNIYKNRMALQIMFIQENKNSASKIAELANKINPDEVQLNTPLRECECRPVSPKEMAKIKEHFSGLNIKTVYDIKRKKITPINIKDTTKRRGKL